MDQGGDCHGCCGPESSARTEDVRRALGLEYLTVGWNIAEGGIAVAAALAAHSPALLGFGADSFVESASGAIMIWRLRAERAKRLSTGDIETLERRAERLITGSLVLLAALVAIDAGRTLWLREAPSSSPVGLALTSISLLVMLWLARAKRRVARRLGSRALQADAFQTTACWWLSLVTLVGLGANAGLGWWWADPVAALGVSGLIVKESIDAWSGERDCC